MCGYMFYTRARACSDRTDRKGPSRAQLEITARAALVFRIGSR